MKAGDLRHPIEIQHFTAVRDPGTGEFGDPAWNKFSDAWASVATGTITECGKVTKANYLPGTTATVPARRLTTFYLPGVTSGITDADDIPIPSNQSDGPALLEAIFAGGGSVNWQVGQLTQWREGPILSLTRTTIAAADF